MLRDPRLFVKEASSSINSVCTSIYFIKLSECLKRLSFLFVYRICIKYCNDKSDQVKGIDEYLFVPEPRTCKSLVSPWKNKIIKLFKISWGFAKTLLKFLLLLGVFFITSHSINSMPRNPRTLRTTFSRRTYSSCMAI